MNTRFLPCLLWLFVAITSTLAQSAVPPKPPVGVPADAQWFNGKWYKVYLEHLPWKRARDRCTSLGGQLVVIPDEQTQVFVGGLAKNLTLWLGASDEKVEGLWRWEDGTQMTYTHWKKGDPNGDRRENWLVMFRGLWEDYPNEAPPIAGFICEWLRK